MDKLTQLEAEYCPPLDVALFVAIVSDFDISTSEGIAEARQTLDPLRDSAALEEAADFEPSGVSIEAANEHSLLSSDGVTDDTSISNGISSLGLEPADSDLNDLDDETKLHLLHDVFGEHISARTIKDSLEKYNGNWNASMEELLTQVYYIEAEDSDGDKLVVKGIDGFSEDRVSRNVKRKKRRKRIAQSTDSTASDGSVESQKPSKWQTAQEDIDFIANHIQVPVSDVRVRYHQNGGSTPRTINSFLKEEMNKPSLDDESQAAARELGGDFPTIAPKYLVALVRVTAPSTAAAHELAKALIRKEKQDTTIVPQYARIADSLIDGSSVDDTRRTTRRMAHLPASTYAAARAQAFAQASAAHRRAKSDRSYGGVAAYYAQVARDLGGLSADSNSAAMDVLASRQSSTTQVDLHGIDVSNGVRIARERVEGWWESLGEGRANGRLGAVDRSTGYSIVVGRGTHSEGGKSKLGPAVTKMLRNEGWKIQDEGAVISVKGKTVQR